MIPNLSAVNSSDILDVYSGVYTSMNMFANTGALNSVKILMIDTPTTTRYVWSVSVPGFVCTGPMVKRNI